VKRKLPILPLKGGLKIVACDFMPKICFLLPKRFLQQFSPGAARLRAVFQKWISVLVTSTGLLATLEPQLRR
jgi:hypothetical protein